jgi:hypothetical protein
MRAGTTYKLEVEREGDASDHSCDCRMRAGTTYFLLLSELVLLFSELVLLYPRVVSSCKMRCGLKVEREGDM